MAYDMNAHIQFLTSQVAHLEAMMTNVKNELMMIKTMKAMNNVDTQTTYVAPPPPFPGHPPLPPNPPPPPPPSSPKEVPKTMQIQCEVPKNDVEIMKKFIAPKNMEYVIPIIDGFEMFYINQTADFETAKKVWIESAANFKEIYMNKAEVANKNRKCILNMQKPKNILSGYQLFTKIMLNYVDPEMKDNSKDKFRCIAKLWNKLSPIEKDDWIKGSEIYNKWHIKLLSKCKNKFY